MMVNKGIARPDGGDLELTGGGGESVVAVDGLRAGFGDSPIGDNGKPFSDIYLTRTVDIQLGYPANKMINAINSNNLSADLDKDEALLKRDVDGGSSYSEAGSVLTLQRDVTNVTAESGNYLELQAGDGSIKTYFNADGHLRVGSGMPDQDSIEGDTVFASTRVAIGNSGISNYSNGLKLASFGGATVISMGKADPIRFIVNSKERVRFETDSNVGINTGGAAQYGGGAGVLGLANASTNPTSNQADVTLLFSTDISGDDATLGIRCEGGVTADADETKFSHKMPVVINGSTYYIMLTDS